MGGRAPPAPAQPGRLRRQAVMRASGASHANWPFWNGDNVWYEGEIVDLCESDEPFKVHYEPDYELDSQSSWHKVADYPCRFAC